MVLKTLKAFNSLRLLFLIVLVALAFWIVPAYSQERRPIEHDLEVWLSPDKNHIEVEDLITFPGSTSSSFDGKFYFLLHAGLNPVSLTPGVKIETVKKGSNNQRSPKSLSPSGIIPQELFSLILPSGQKSFSIKYQGKIYHPLEQAGENHARGFSGTPGIISNEGIFLAGSSNWYPEFGNDLLTFKMRTHLSQTWDAVSQGQIVEFDRNAKETKVVWESKSSQEEIFLIGGSFTSYSRKSGRIEALVFLRRPDEDLANKYLEVTSQYIDMYEGLLGPYPYKKFALVENFWETGYGMPSFTLLGPRVIRLPFILHSSYPHEILHNWFGNGIYVNYEKGNWAEGLTAYLADHLIKEQSGRAADYRRGTLQKYTDYISGQNDFPLMEFRSRHSSSTEAVGYGKSLMVFHMLRQMFGDEIFIKSLNAYYKKHKFSSVGFDDLRQTFEEFNGIELKDFFNQWVSLPGAPELKIGQTKVSRVNGKYKLKATLEQVQEGEPYSLKVPLAVTLENVTHAYQTVLESKNKVHEIEIEFSAKPMRLDIDPEFDVFRRLARNEISPALTQVFGADKVLMVLPSKEKSLIDSYKGLAESLANSYSDAVEIKMDNEIQELPIDKTVWVLGWENRFLARFSSAVKNYGAKINSNEAKIGNKRIVRSEHSLAVTTRHPDNPELGWAWVGIGDSNAFSGFARKLPHYHKYSYLAFQGGEPTNILKEKWPVLNSPMTVFFSEGDTAKPERGKLAPRNALAYLPPVFSKKRMMSVVDYLSSPELRGRGFGTLELDKAADYIAKQFKKSGLLPIGDVEGSYFQSWKELGGDPEVEATLKNIVGIIPGKKAKWKEQSVVLGAHYDHLGLGWPDAREGNKGKIHHGADDNASGIAVLLELARALSESKPDRTIVFVAFTGEESGLRGSKYFVKHFKKFPINKSIAAINLDTVGRLENKKLMVIGSGSAREWPHIFRGAGYVSGVGIANVSKDLGSSDQKSFLDVGVPAVQIFSGANLDYHNPTDTSDKIDQDGLLKVASVVKEALEYLAHREEPLHANLGKGSKSLSSSNKPNQKKGRVSLGTVPDFEYEGEGVRISDISPSSPAEAAGLSGGDIITKINSEPISNLRQFSEFLKKLKSGDKIKIHFLRKGKPQNLETTVVSR